MQIVSHRERTSFKEDNWELLHNIAKHAPVLNLLCGEQLIFGKFTENSIKLSVKLLGRSRPVATETAHNLVITMVSNKGAME